MFEKVISVFDNEIVNRMEVTVVEYDATQARQEIKESELEVTDSYENEESVTLVVEDNT